MSVTQQLLELRAQRWDEVQLCLERLQWLSERIEMIDVELQAVKEYSPAVAPVVVHPQQRQNAGAKLPQCS